MKILILVILILCMLVIFNVNTSEYLTNENEMDNEMNEPDEYRNKKQEEQDEEAKLTGDNTEINDITNEDNDASQIAPWQFNKCYNECVEKGVTDPWFGGPSEHSGPNDHCKLYFDVAKCIAQCNLSMWNL